MYATLRAPLSAPNRYFVIIFLVSCAMLAGFTYTLYQQSKEREKYDQLTIQSYENIRLFKHILELTIDIETGQRGYLLTKSREFLQPYYAGLANIDPTFALVRKKIRSPKQIAQLDDTIQKSRAWRLYVIRQIQAFENSASTGLTVGDLRTSKDLMDDVRLSVDTFITSERELLKTRTEISRHKQKQYFLTLFLGALLAVGGLLVANFIIMGLVARSRKTDEQLARILETYGLLLESLKDGIYDFYPLSGTIHFSKSYCELLGYAKHEIPEDVEMVRRMVHPADLPRALEVLEKYQRHEITDYYATFRMRHKDGSWRWILSRGVGTWNQQDQMTRLIGIHTDITEQKQREEALRQVNEEMESFIYIASHDMRAPLVNLKGFAGEIGTVLEEAKPLLEPCITTLPKKEQAKLQQAFEEDIPEALTFIKSGVERMDSLTNAILDLSRIGRRQVRLESVDTQALVQRCLDSLAYELSQRGIDMDVGPMPNVVSDPIILEQVFGNIIDNAIKYLAPERKGRIRIHGRNLQDEVEFCVEDNGRGIALADHKKVFDIFRRASNSGDVRGVGMGMAYVKASIRKLGGTIWFDSTLGKGTCFYFTIPAWEDKRAELHAMEDAA